jgi:hypothetical protein
MADLSATLSTGLISSEISIPLSGFDLAVRRGEVVLYDFVKKTRNVLFVNVAEEDLVA